MIIWYYLFFFFYRSVELGVSKSEKQIFLGFVFEKFLLLAVYMRSNTHLIHKVINAFQPFTTPKKLDYPTNESKFD